MIVADAVSVAAVGVVATIGFVGVTAAIVASKELSSSRWIQRPVRQPDLSPARSISCVARVGVFCSLTSRMYVTEESVVIELQYAFAQRLHEIVREGVDGVLIDDVVGYRRIRFAVDGKPSRMVSVRISRNSEGPVDLLSRMGWIPP